MYKKGTRWTKFLKPVDVEKVHLVPVNILTISMIIHKTRNRLRVANLSGCVTKILALPRMAKIDFPPEFPIRHQMHSFLIMYNTMGSKVDGLAVKDHFLPKNGLKTAIWGKQIRDRLTTEEAETQIWKMLASFDTFPKFLPE